ncbi:MAG: bifunctional 4-hydroxy-3-methylbut-2-enyl diphosphate reductase/30S ribosomal protein S1 [Clostridiales bacterium]|nr:bifunctional 4-hydroxy-3-methylbut-2-enyl diphosphate reductase/30S ribosomal protein S1 [Clostridiales bacterium]
MRVITAKNSGFCVGVKHAVDTALSLDSENTYVLGEIVHNPQVVEEIKNNGIKCVETLEELPDNCTVLFRSHGVPESYYDECEKRGIKIVDCTCSYVKRTQRIIKEQYELGRQIVIIGKPNHPEVCGLVGWCANSACVLNENDPIPDWLSQKDLSVVCQTTFSVEKFEKIIKNIKKVCEKTVAVFKTICYTTIERQREVEELSKVCDAVIVLGGLNSSNTNKLYEIAKANCANVFRLSSVGQFDFNELKKFKSIGIVSGASTPNAQTREVLLKMAENTEVKATNTMEDVVAKIDSESKFKKGQTVTATISQATEDGLQILLPYSKKEVALSKDELDCEVYNASDYVGKIGETIELLVVELKPSLKLSQKMIKVLEQEESLGEELKGGKEFSVVCTGFNKGGLVGRFGTYSVFVPAKEIRPGFVKDLSKYEGKTLRLRAIDVKKNEKRKEIIASQRVILQEEYDAKAEAKAEKEEAFFASIAVGDVVEGKVERVTDFGAFVSVNGFDCLAHISDLSWTSVEKVTDVLEIGNTYSFKVLRVDSTKKKVSIGYKQLQPQPWDLVEEKYHVDDVIHGKVVRIVPFGAFIEVEKGIDGLVHVSQISHERIETPATCLNVGDEVDAKIIAINAEARKMNLSIKALLPEGEKKRPQKVEEGEEGHAPKRTRAPKKTEDDEVSSWNEGSIAGTSIADLLANAKK